MGYCIGLMSGTSLDGIDAALVRIDNGAPVFIQGAYLPFTTEFTRELSELAHREQVVKEQMIRMDALLGHLLADAAYQVVDAAGVAMSEVDVIGSHGLTIGHYPQHRERFGRNTGFTLQIGDGDVIAVRTGRTVVSDFRRRDMAAGGEGAPLIPVLDAAIFRTRAQNRACLNIGGIANITILPADPNEPVVAFDTGPGNCLLDMAVQRLVSEDLAYDPGGQYAARGVVDQALVDRLLADGFFVEPPPKSTGRERFSEAYLEHVLTIGRTRSFDDLLSTVAALTVDAVVAALARWVPEPLWPQELIVSGGGVHNAFFMSRLAARLPDCAVMSSAMLGVDPDFKEAVGFAWMAWRTMRGLPSGVPTVTGAETPQVLGKISTAAP